ncbi:MAG TPA: DNA-primase RepB domain-containing protein [Herpetosiphonaceae bacterium]|nr:DNA-primase RepB domain-containing protein [Herpetosiphonaceae bacterium]
MTPPRLEDQTLRFLAHLHRAGQHAYWWTVAGHKKTSIWWQPGRPAPMPNSQHNLYFGVHPCAVIPVTNARGEPAPAAAVRSQAATIAAINCLFAEFDAKHFAGGKAEALAHIEQLAPAPSVIVDSGGGYHCYWLLDEPFILATDADRARAARAQKDLVKFVRSDEGAKDLARVLRVPGTRNFKPEYGPDFPLVRFVRADFAQLYTLPQLEACLPATQQPLLAPEPLHPLPAAFATDHARRYVLAALEGERQKMLAAGDGERHHRRYDSAYALAGFLHTGALTEDEIFASLAVNFGPDRRNAEQTICDGMRAGREYPRDIPPPAPRDIHSDLVMPLEADDDLEVLEADELRRRLRAVVAERDRWKERAVQLELQLGQVQERNRFVTQTHGAEGIGNPGMRLTFIELKKELDRVPREERTPDQWVRIRPAYMATCTNQNRSTISNHLAAFQEAGKIEKDVRRMRDPETGEWVSETFVRPLVDLSDPTQVVIPTKPRGRQACRKCGSEKLVREVKIYCAECEHVQSHDVDLLNSPEPDLQTANQEDDGLQEAIAFFDEPPASVGDAPPDALICKLQHKEKTVDLPSELQSANQTLAAVDRPELQSANQPTTYNPDYRQPPRPPALVFTDPLDLPGVRNGLIAPDDPWILEQQRLAASAAPAGGGSS